MAIRTRTPAPFSVGTRLRYVGDHESFIESLNGTVPFYYHGMEVIIEETKMVPCLRDDVMVIEGRCVFYLDIPTKNGSRLPRAIFPDRASDWVTV